MIDPVDQGGQQALDRLIQAGKLVEAMHPKTTGDWLALPELA